MEGDAEGSVGAGIGGIERPALLLVEDDLTIGGHLRAGLEQHGHQVYWSTTAADALHSAREHPPQIVLLDLGLPDLDGIELARLLRTEHPALLLIILTARADEIDVIVGLDAGADDYLVKPFSLSVLLARIRAHRRRRPSPGADEAEVIAAADVVLDLVGRRCLFAGREIDLRPKEFDLAVTLARRPGTAISREQLMAEVWDENWFGSTKTLDVTIAALRRRWEDAAARGGQAPRITTLRGFGYRLEPSL